MCHSQHGSTHLQPEQRSNQTRSTSLCGFCRATYSRYVIVFFYFSTYGILNFYSSWLLLHKQCYMQKVGYGVSLKIHRWSFLLSGVNSVGMCRRCTQELSVFHPWDLPCMFKMFPCSSTPDSNKGNFTSPQQSLMLSWSFESGKTRAGL